MDFVSYSADNVIDNDFEHLFNKNVFLTPHLAGNTHESIEIASQRVFQKFYNSLSG